MKRLSNNTLAGLMICLMLTSLIGTTFISYIAEKRATVSGQVPIQQSGLVGVEVLTASTPSGGGSGAGGGGGGGGGRAPKIHIVDFRIKEIYNYFVDKGDTVIVIFSDTDKYILKVEEHILKQTVSFNIDGTKFEVKSDEVTSVDFDRDNLVDMTIKFDDDGKIVFSLFHKPKTPEIVNPIISSQKISKEEAEKPIIPEEKASYLWLLIILIILIICILAYQHYKIRNVEKYQKRRNTKMSSNNKTTNVQSKDLVNEKLKRQLELLDKGYNSGFISKEAYFKGKKRIKDSMNKL